MNDQTKTETTKQNHTRKLKVSHAIAGKLNQHMTGKYLKDGDEITCELVDGKPHFRAPATGTLVSIGEEG